MKAFQGYHPIILFLYFMGIIFISMFTMHPILIVTSFVLAIVFCGMLTGAKETLKSMAYSLPMLAIIALTNPLFVHKGETLLFFLNDNPVTKEAIVYGIMVAMMIISVFHWFKCYNEIMTSDKFIYLFGRVIPKLSLLLSMSISFIPKFKRRYREIDEAQKAMGIYTSKSYFDRINSKIRVLNILISWSLESSIDTADSMRARGYGLKGRTSYSIFKWTKKDSIMLALLSISLTFVCALMFMDYAEFAYYPTFSNIDFSLLAISLYVSLFFVEFIATMVEIKENVLWRYLKLKI